MAAPVPRHARARLRPWLADPHVLLAVAITVGTISIEVVSDRAALPGLAVPLLVNGVAQWAGHRLAGRHPRKGLDTARLLVALATVTWMSFAASAAGAVPLTLLYIPIVTMAAAIGTRPAAVVGAVSIVATVTLAMTLRAALPPGFAEASGVDPADAALQRGMAMVTTMVVLAIGTRRTVGTLERAVSRARSATSRSRRQAQQMAAVEEVGRLLAASGPTRDGLERVMDVLVGRFGYRFVSIYTVDGPLLRLGAQRGYTTVIETFDGSVGVVGRVMRTGRPELVTDVRLDQDYASADPDVRSEVCVPLRTAEGILGVLNVESDAAHPLDASDRDTLIVIGDRIASALALAREREALQERAAVFSRLIRFGTAIEADLGSEAVRGAVVRSVAEVLDASAVALVVRDPGTGEDRIAAMHGGDPRYVGARIMPGEGMSGRAMAERRIVTQAEMTRADLPTTVQGADIPAAFAAGAMPLLHDDRIIGAISVSRFDLARPFTPLEIETMEIIASQVATTLVNAALHDQVAEAAIRDPLTGLWNRRQLDVGLARLFATRDRMDPDARRPVSAILFDLDHFGDFNKRHGHGTGDTVLRAFGRILDRRLRSSDLVARFGGEEFVAVLDGATIDEAARIADDVRREFEGVRFRGIDGTDLRATVSAGCAALGPGVASFGALLELADVGLQMAKRGGRNQVVAA
jgi:diguanylate cyclase (GGDEF)-like protein